MNEAAVDVNIYGTTTVTGSLFVTGTLQAGTLHASTLLVTQSLQTTGQLLLAAASTGDAGTDADDIVIGDGVTDVGLTFYAGDAGQAGKLAWNDGTDVDDGAIAYTPSTNLMAFSVAGNEELRLNASVLGPHSTPGGLDLGTAAVPFGNAYATSGVLGYVTASTTHLAGAAAGDAASNANSLIIGDGNSDVGMTINHGSNTARLNFKDASNDADFSMRYNGGSMTYRVNNTDAFLMSNVLLRPVGGITADLGDATQFWRSGSIEFVTASTVHISDAQPGQASALANNLVIGNVGALTSHGISILGERTQDKHIFFGSDTDETVGGISYDGGTNSLKFRTDGADKAYVDTSKLAPNSDEGLALGAVSDRWSNVYATTGTLDFVTASTAYIGGAIADNTALYSQDSGSSGIQLGKTGNGWESLWLAELAPAGAPTTIDAEAVLWVTNDAHQTLTFTDDEGNKHALNKWEISLSAHQAELPGTSPATKLAGSSGIGGRTVLEYSNGASDTAYWQFAIPRAYAGGDLTLGIWYCGGSSNAGGNTVDWRAAFELFIEGVTSNTTGFDSAQTISDAPDATALDFSYAEITFTSSEIDGATAGDWVMIYLTRDGSGDSYSSVAYVFGVHLIESA